jgi:hypothetical protein
MFLGSFFALLSQNLLGFVNGPNCTSLKFAAFMNENSEIIEVQVNRILLTVTKDNQVSEQESSLSLQMIMIGHRAAGLIAKAWIS